MEELIAKFFQGNSFASFLFHDNSREFLEIRKIDWKIGTNDSVEQTRKDRWDKVFLARGSVKTETKSSWSANNNDRRVTGTKGNKGADEKYKSQASLWCIARGLCLTLMADQIRAPCPVVLERSYRVRTLSHPGDVRDVIIGFERFGKRAVWIRGWRQSVWNRVSGSDVS